MELLKLKEMEMLINSPEYMHSKLVIDIHERLKQTASEFVQAYTMMHTGEEWNPWYAENLSEDEKTYFDNTYNGIMAMIETSK